MRALEQRIEELKEIIPGGAKFIDQQHVEWERIFEDDKHELGEYYHKLDPIEQNKIKLCHFENVLNRVKAKIEDQEFVYEEVK